MTRRRPFTNALVAALVGLAVVVALPTGAFAHVNVDQKSVPADSDAVLRFNVPVEAADHDAGRPDLNQRHNERVTVEIPAGFTASTCEAKPGWACQVNPAASKTPHHVAFSRTGPPFDAVDSFNIAVHTASQPGSYPFEVNQTYSEGDTSHWDGPPGSASPAPVVKVA